MVFHPFHLFHPEDLLHLFLLAVLALPVRLFHLALLFHPVDLLHLFLLAVLVLPVRLFHLALLFHPVDLDLPFLLLLLGVQVFPALPEVLENQHHPELPEDQFLPEHLVHLQVPVNQQVHAHPVPLVLL